MSTHTFRTGATAAEEASKSQGGGKFSKWEYFSIKDEKDPVRIVRFLTDVDATPKADGTFGPGWITVAMHPSMLTRPAPADYKGKWPTSMGAVCRVDADKGVRTFPEHADCFHCLTPGGDGKPRRKHERTWGLGILREEFQLDVPVNNPDGTPQLNPDGTPVTRKVTAMRDQMREVARMKDGQTEPEVTLEPFYVVFVQAWSNFWSPVQGIASMKGTCLDRDYRIVRKGFTMNDTDYQIAPYDPLQVDLNDGKGARILDFRDPDVLALYDIPDLGEIVANQASDEYYDRFFDTRHVQPKMGKEEGAATTANAATAVATPATEPTQAAIQSIADRVSGMPGVTPAVAQGYGANAGVATTTGLPISVPGS